MGQEVGRAELMNCCTLNAPDTQISGVVEGEENQHRGKSDSQEDSKLKEPGLKQFLIDTALHFGFLWAGRLFYVRNKNSRIFRTSFSQWFDNISGVSEFDDEDSFVTNFVYHPLFGAEYYLFYRARGHSFWASALGSVIQSTFFEYAIEGLVEEPSLPDLIFTPGIGVPMGFVMENMSDWLIKRENSVAKAAAYVVNPLRIFIRDRKFGIVNPVAGTFAFQAPFTLTPSRSKAILLSYPFFLEPPLPVGRLVGSFEVVDLEEEAGGQIIFYSIRVDLPSENNLYGIYIKVPYSGVNNVTLDGDKIGNGFEFSNLLIGGKFVLLDTEEFVLSGGLEVVPPTAFKDNIRRLESIVNLPFLRDLPTYLTDAVTVTPYLSAAYTREKLSLQGNLGIDSIFNADNFEGDAFETRINYGTAFGVSTSFPTSPSLFVEFNGYTLLSASSVGKTDIFLTPGVRLGKRYGPGLGIQIPITGPTADVTNASFIFDFQGRF
jgi:hypothetical protein